MEKDYNHLGPWLKKKLEERNLSVEDLARLCKPRISRRSLYMWMDDSARPTAQNITKVCHALSDVPTVGADATTQKVEVTTEEAFKQYTERKMGRPAEKSSRLRS